MNINRIFLSIAIFLVFSTYSVKAMRFTEFITKNRKLIVETIKNCINTGKGKLFSEICFSIRDAGAEVQKSLDRIGGSETTSIDTKDLVFEIASKFGIKRPENIKVMHHDGVEHIGQSFTVPGTTKGDLLFVPILDKETITEVDLFIIAHELSHIKHKDATVILVTQAMGFMSGFFLLIGGDGLRGLCVQLITLMALKLIRKTQEVMADLDSASLGKKFVDGGIHCMDNNEEVSFSFILKALCFMKKLLKNHPSTKNRLRYLKWYRDKYYKSKDTDSKLDEKTVDEKNEDEGKIGEI